MNFHPDLRTRFSHPTKAFAVIRLYTHHYPRIHTYICTLSSLSIFVSPFTYKYLHHIASQDLIFFLIFCFETCDSFYLKSKVREWKKEKKYKAKILAWLHDDEDEPADLISIKPFFMGGWHNSKINRESQLKSIKLYSKYQMNQKNSKKYTYRVEFV